MRSSVKFFFCLLLVPSLGHSGRPLKIETASVYSVALYIKDFGVNPLARKGELIGFSSSRIGDTFNVEVIYADLPGEAQINQYECASNQVLNHPCTWVSQFPKCFYFGERGYFSVLQIGDALDIGLRSIRTEGIDTDSLFAVKIWQSGRYIYSKFSFKSDGKVGERRYTCSESNQLTCNESNSNDPHEP